MFSFVLSNYRISLISLSIILCYCNYLLSFNFIPYFQFFFSLIRIHSTQIRSLLSLLAQIVSLFIKVCILYLFHVILQPFNLNTLPCPTSTSFQDSWTIWLPASGSEFFWLFVFFWFWFILLLFCVILTNLSSEDSWLHSKDGLKV